MAKSERLFNRNFILLSIANLIMFNAFYLLMPIIAMYVVDEFDADSGLAGVVAASYIITALLVRPFSGYLVDKYDRKLFFIFMFALFATLFAGYVVSNTITQLIITRVLLGGTFALITTVSNTLAIDVIPSSRRAEGVGYYGAIIVLAMAVGPMIGLYMIEYFSYNDLFTFAASSVWVGLLFAIFVRTKPRESIIHKDKLSVDRFLLMEGVSIVSIIGLLYFLYGTLMVYVSLYVRECGLSVNSANFFTLFAIGIIISRVVSGRYLRRGLHDKTLQIGIYMIIIAGALFATILTDVTFPISSIMLGGGFGLVGPSIQTMVVDLVPAARRGTANSTYFIALDLGSGLGMLVGGTIAGICNYQGLYLVGVALAIFALLLYYLYSRRDYKNNLAASKVINS